MRNSEGVGLEFDTYQVHLKTLTAQWKKTFENENIPWCIDIINEETFLCGDGGGYVTKFTLQKEIKKFKIHDLQINHVLRVKENLFASTSDDKNLKI